MTNHTHPSILFPILYPILPLYTAYLLLLLILIFTMLQFHSVITILSQFYLFLLFVSCVHIVSFPLILSYMFTPDSRLLYLSPISADQSVLHLFPPPGSSHHLLCFHSSLYVSFFLFLYIIS